MPGIFVAPDRQTRLIGKVGTFEVDADVPDTFVRERIFPVKAKAFVEQLGKRGYQLQGKVYLYRQRYDVIAATDDGKASLGAYEHDDAKRGRVERRMFARFLVKDVYISADNMEGLRGFHSRR